MTGKREAKRTELKQKLLDSAIKRIDRDGIDSLRARDLANDAGCALGAIYNIYKDLDELVFDAKVTIFTQMEDQLATAMNGTEALSPLDRMVRLSEQYYGFATSNRNLWSALFDGDLTDGREIPVWYQRALERLMGHIAVPLKQLDPSLSAEQISLKTRTLFSVVHGIVLLSIQDRPSGVKPDEVPEAIGWVLKSVCNSL